MEQNKAEAEQLQWQNLSSKIILNNVPLMAKVLVGVLYFLQGFILSLGGTMPYVYQELPNYNVLSLFAAASLPFAFKFITAPFIEKYSSVAYGKRKTWIIISQMCCMAALLTSSFFTALQDAVILSVLFIFAVFWITLQDIALDSLAIKQIKIAYFVSLLQAISQSTGYVLGSLIFLKATSMEFASSLGLSEPLATPRTILLVLAITIFILTISIHFWFKETVLEEEKNLISSSLWEVIKRYRAFLNISTEYCRTCIFFILYSQGTNLFMAGYDYELIRAGFSRDINNTISNIVVLPVSVLACALSSKIQVFGILNSLMVSRFIQWLIMLYIWVYFPTSVPFIAGLVFLMQIIGTWKFLTQGIIINNFPVTAVSGMFITMLASFTNLGKSVALQTKLTGVLGWKATAGIGIFFQLLLIIITPILYRWVKAGSLNQNTQIQGEDNPDRQ